jgi:O-antigen ligase
MLLGEAIQQVAAAIALVLAIVIVARRWRPPFDTGCYIAASLTLALWQLVSPLAALATGAMKVWPPASRYGQVLDTVATSAVAIVGAAEVPWLLLGVILACGWVAATLVGLHQHFVRWTWAPFFLKRQLWRLQENFGTDAVPRFAAGGFLFHRLRLAHSAIATLGPALTLAFQSQRRRWPAGLVVAALLVSVYATYARAALAAGLVLVVLAAVLLLRRAQRLVALAIVVITVGAAALSPTWQARFVQAMHNVSADGERTRAMNAGWQAAQLHPWLGVGFGNHWTAAKATELTSGVTDLLANDSHNLWLTAWVETGVVGLILLLCVHVTLAWALLRRARRGSPAALGALLSFVGFLLLSLVHYLPFHTSVHLSFALFWGLGLCDGSELLVRAPRGPGPGSAASPS